MYKVSVIIPVFNAGKYIEHCVRSLFEQTLDSIEYIFVDDCSPDNSMDILYRVLEEYPHRKDDVVVISHTSNTGQSGARKDGMSVASGEYTITETVAPNGYNKLTARQKFIISDGNLDAVFNAGIYSTGSGVHVVNKTGSMLPETGAMGTLMFISFGMFVALGTGILLVTKKRMSMIED